eukprot:GILJ01000221.1.p1 GENE.GILJ01000221.1~~GILJ01000221.1.p1  ORF type:complete len:499 (+),score=128.10 GILJ01000221.1:42-1499(+)
MKSVAIVLFALLAVSASAQVTWVCTASKGEWSSAPCWSSSRVPSKDDDVVLGNADFTMVALGQDIQVKSLSLTNTVTLVLQDSSFTSAGKVAVGSSAKVIYDTSAEIKALEVNVEGTLEWKRGVIKSLHSVSGDVIIDDGAAKELNGAHLVVGGSGKFSAGVLFMHNAGQIIVQPSGTFSINGAQSIVPDVDCLINNAGVLNFESSIEIPLPVLNTGKVNVNSGVTVTFQPPQSKLVVTESGLVTVSKDATLVLASNGNSFSSGSKLSVAGSLQVIGDLAVYSQEDTKIESLSLDKGGKISGSGDLEVNTMNWFSGTVLGNSKLAISSLAVSGPFPIVLDGRHVVVSSAKFSGEADKTINVIFTDTTSKPSFDFLADTQILNAHRFTGNGAVSFHGKTVYSNTADKVEYSKGVNCGEGQCLIIDAGIAVVVHDGASLSADAGIISIAGSLEHHGNLVIADAGMFHFTGKDKVMLPAKTKNFLAAF